MVQILISKSNQGKIEKIEVDGHADSGPYGNDLVCAAISAVVVGCSNSFTFPKNLKIEIAQGHYLLDTYGFCSYCDYFVVRTLYICLKTIAEKYPRFVNWKEREI